MQCFVSQTFKLLQQRTLLDKILAEKVSIRGESLAKPWIFPPRHYQHTPYTRELCDLRRTPRPVANSHMIMRQNIINGHSATVCGCRRSTILLASVTTASPAAIIHPPTSLKSLRPSRETVPPIHRRINQYFKLTAITQTQVTVLCSKSAEYTHLKETTTTKNTQTHMQPLQFECKNPFHLSEGVCLHADWSVFVSPSCCFPPAANASMGCLCFLDGAW